MNHSPEPIYRISLPEKEIILIGTAHVSEASVRTVEEVVSTERPDGIAVELDEARCKALEHPDTWKKLDILQVIKQGKVYALLSQVLLSSYQKRLGKHLHVTPGAEMKRAVELARAQHTHLMLADRDIKITLKRVWAALTFGQKFHLLGGILKGIFNVDEVRQEDIERLKSSDALTEALREFSEKLPDVKEPLIDERDRYLAAKIRRTPGKKIVAVIGAAHCPGIMEHIHHTYPIEPLETIPAPSLGSTLLGWSIPAVLIALVIGGFFIGQDLGEQMLVRWAIINAASAALGALIALAHPLSILGAACAAPFTPLHPLLASGFVSGGIEAWLRKPTVLDFESLTDDIGSFRGLYHNRLLKIFVVVVLTNLCGALGALGALGKIMSML